MTAPQQLRLSGGLCDFLRFRNLAVGIVLLTCLFSFVSAGPLQLVSYAQQSAQEYELKAVYLYNFLQFVQWPDSHRVYSKDGAMVIGIVGESPFGNALEDLRLSVLKNGMKPVTIVYYGPYRESSNLRNCHLLFIGSSEMMNAGRIIASLRGSSVLTVADSEGFTASGGMIKLVRSQGKIRWIINKNQTDRAGLHLSAQLLSIATKVIEDHE